MNKKIGFLTRKPILGVHFSIENALNQVRNGLLKTGKWEIDWLEMPCYSKGFVPRLKSMFFARYHQKDINHITGDIYFIALFLPGKSLVITIHDILFLYPKRGPTWLVLWFFWIYLPVLKAKVIVAVSEHTKNEILRITRCHATKIKVIPPLISPKFQYFPKIFQKECPIILHVGTAWNKNLVNHIKALRGIPCLLNIVGMLSKSQRLALKKAEINYQNKVQLSEKEMLALYQSSDILLFASLAEGFGLPILEAQSVGRVVITADRGATAEVAGKGALLVNPRAPEDIRKGILAVVNDDVLRAFYISEGFKNRYQYSSKSVTEQYDRVFSSM